jgi:DNA polymerase III epsilon subunit family exonuclease
MECIAFDVETTGLWPESGHRIIEIGAIRLQDGVPVEEFQTLINPGCQVPHRAQAIHGISTRMLQHQPSPEEALSAFFRFSNQVPLIAHNAAFDMGFLAAEYRRLGLELTNASICTLQWSRRSLRLQSHKLENVFLHLGGTLPPGLSPHRALADAKMVAFVWQKLNSPP